MRNAWAWLAGAAGATALALAALVVLPRPEMPQTGGDAPAVAASEPEAASPAPEPVASLTSPEIQSLRVEADGLSVISGRAQAGEEVAILLDGAELARAHAGPDGRFAAIVTLPPDNAPSMLALLADPDGAALPSDAEVLIAPRAAPVEPVEPSASISPEADAPDGLELALADPALASPDAEEMAPPAADEPAPEPPGVVAQSGDVETSPPPAPLLVTQAELAPDAGDLPVAAGAPAPLPEVPALTPGQPDAPETAPEDAQPPFLALDSQGVRVLAPPPSVDAPEAIALDIIAYDPEGEVSLGGRAGPEGFVRVYLDNAAVAAATVMDGRWTVALPDEVAPGTYTLRVDEMDAGGEVVSRLETAFLRESPASLATAIAEGAAQAGGVSVRTVQSGSSLWRIARERYGRGILYVEVFEANRDRIRDPDLIYPGQVFLLPEIGEVGLP